MIKFPLELFQKVFIILDGYVFTKEVASIRCSDTKNPNNSCSVFVLLDTYAKEFKFNFNDSVKGFWRQDAYNPSTIYYTIEEADKKIRDIYLREKKELEEKLKTIKKKLKNM